MVQRMTTTAVSDMDQHATDPGQRPRYPLTKAAQMVGVSQSTMKRRLKAGAFPNAVQDESGAWAIGVDDLLAAGFHLNGQTPVHISKPTPVSEPMQRSVTQGPDPELIERISVLERLLAVEQVKREAAEQIAAEREKRAATAERALLMLESAAVTPQPQDVPKQRWWRR